MPSNFNMKIVRDPLFPERRVSQTLFGRGSICGIMMMDQELLPVATPSVPVDDLPTPPVMAPHEPADPPPDVPAVPPVADPEQPPATTPTPAPTPDPTPTPNPEPVITTQPIAVRALVGSEVQLSVTADNANSYKWQRLVAGLWVDVSGARSKTLTLSAVATADATAYRAVASGAGGSTTSSAATVKVDSAFIGIGKTALLGVDLTASPIIRLSPGQQRLPLALKTGAVTFTAGKFLAGALGQVLGAVLSPLTGGLTTLKASTDDPAVASVTLSGGAVTLKPLKTGKTWLRLFADGAGTTPDAFGVVEIIVS